MAEAQRPRSPDGPSLAIVDRDNYRPQLIPGTRLRSNPPPDRFLDRLAETRTACPVRFLVLPLPRRIVDHAVQAEFLDIHFSGAHPELSLPRSPFETARSISRHSP
jgi:hypothetical protein